MATCKIKDHTVAPTNSYIFDTNVWMFIFAPLANAKNYKQKACTQLLSDIRSRNATIWINSLIISEYVNAVLKLAFKQWKEKNGYANSDKVSYKLDFRPTADYKDALTDVMAQVSEIIKLCECRPDDLNAIDVKGIINSMGNFECDFGDAMIMDLCTRNKEIKLVTDDHDITDMASLPFTVIAV